MDHQVTGRVHGDGATGFVGHLKGPIRMHLEGPGRRMVQNHPRCSCDGLRRHVGAMGAGEGAALLVAPFLDDAEACPRGMVHLQVTVPMDMPANPALMHERIKEGLCVNLIRILPMEGSQPYGKQLVHLCDNTKLTYLRKPDGGAARGMAAAGQHPDEPSPVLGEIGPITEGDEHSMPFGQHLGHDGGRDQHQSPVLAEVEWRAGVPPAAGIS